MQTSTPIIAFVLKPNVRHRFEKKTQRAYLKGQFNEIALIERVWTGHGRLNSLFTTNNTQLSPSLT